MQIESLDQLFSTNPNKHTTVHTWIKVQNTTFFANGIKIRPASSFVYRHKIVGKKITSQKAKHHIPVKNFSEITYNCRDALIFYVDDDGNIYFDKYTRLLSEVTTPTQVTMVDSGGIYPTIYIPSNCTEYIRIPDHNYRKPFVRYYQDIEHNPYIKATDVPLVNAEYNKLVQKYGVTPNCKYEASPEYWESYKETQARYPNLIPYEANTHKLPVTLQSLHTDWVDAMDIAIPIAEYFSQKNPLNKVYLTFAEHLLNNRDE